jgi:hypothetical protein
LDSEGCLPSASMPFLEPGTGHRVQQPPSMPFLEPDETKRRVTSRVNYVVWAFGVEVYWASEALAAAK